MNRAALILLVLSLTGCLDDFKPKPDMRPKECFDILQSKDAIRPILFNKCTGETWMLVYITLLEKDEKGSKLFTYRWYPLDKASIEPILSYGGGM